MQNFKFLSAAMCFSLFSVFSWAQTWDGSTKQEPANVENIYQISNGAELAWFSAQAESAILSANAVLTADIDLGNHPWTPIGLTKATCYTGVFDGQGHHVKGLYIEVPNTKSAFWGLFGFLGSSTAQIKNVSVSGAIEVPAGNTVETNVGAIVGDIDSAAGITNCHSDATITVNGKVGYVGGLIGLMKAVEVTHCSYTGKIEIAATMAGCKGCGGIVGTSNSGTKGISETIKDCFFAGEIVSNLPDGNANLASIGGILGYANLSAGFDNIINCYGYGTITGVVKSDRKDFIIGRTDSGNLDIQNTYGLSSLDHGYGIAKEADAFNSGEIAYLLNGDQTLITFGQDLSSADNHPVYFNNNRVYRIQFMASDAMFATTYCNSTLKLIQDEPTQDNCKFVGWFDADGTAYTADTQISDDITLYARFNNIVVGINDISEETVHISVIDGNIAIDAIQTTQITVYTSTGSALKTIVAPKGRTIIPMNDKGLFIVNGKKVIL